VFSVWTGFDTDVNNGIGFVATYMTRKRTISISEDCGYRSGTDYNFCGQRADPNLRITDWAGFTPHDTGVGIYTWARLGAWRGVAWRGVVWPGGPWRGPAPRGFWAFPRRVVVVELPGGNCPHPRLRGVCVWGVGVGVGVGRWLSRGVWLVRGPFRDNHESASPPPVFPRSPSFVQAVFGSGTALAAAAAALTTKPTSRTAGRRRRLA
jgi:hypothetical protein